MPNPLPSGWIACRVDDIKAGEDRSIAIVPFGSRLKAEEYTPAGIPVIRGNNISDTRALVGDLVYVSAAKANELRSSIVRPGDLVFPHRGLIGTVGIIAGPPNTRALLSTSLMKLTPDPNVVDPAFLFYFFRSPRGRHQLLKNASQVGTPGIATPLASLRSADLIVPSLHEQREIAAVLGALDDKIDLNRRTNQTLESMARAIFKSWFVDFDPVRAKAEGRQPAGMDANTAALFPAGWDHHNGVTVPSGWRTSGLRTRMCRIQYGLTQSARTDSVGPRFLRITDIRGGHVDWPSVPYAIVSAQDHQEYRLNEGDILVARTGASTGDNVYVIDAPDAVFASYLVRFQFAERGIARVVAEFMRTEDYTAFVAGVIGGSAQPNASAQVLASAPFAFPSDEISERFYAIVHPLDLRRAANDRESRALAALRDTLLPKLLSGEVRIREAEKVVEAHV